MNDKIKQIDNTLYKIDRYVGKYKNYDVYILKFKQNELNKPIDIGYPTLLLDGFDTIKIINGLKSLEILNYFYKDDED